MGFTYPIKLPGLKTTVQATEICAKTYRDIVKSQYNGVDSLFLDQINSLVKTICPGIFETLDIIDKTIILLTARAISVSGILNLNVTCSETKKAFEYNLKLNDIIEKLTNLSYGFTTTDKNFTVEYSVVKAKDEKFFLERKDNLLPFYQLASCIDKIFINGKQYTEYNNISFYDRLKIIDNLPIALSQKILRQLYIFEKQLSQIKLITISSPFSKTKVVDIPCSIDTQVIIEICKLLFKEDLNTVYQIVYNLVHRVGFSPEYVDSITPAEQQLYWSYFLQQVNKEQQSKESENPLIFNGKTTPSEFTA